MGRGFPRCAMAKGLLSLIAVFWTILWVMVSLLEIMPFLHRMDVPAWLPIALIVPSLLAAAAWSWGWLASRAYENISLEQPRRWFFRALAFAPLFALIELAFVQGVHAGAFALAHLPFWHVPWPALILYEIVKAALFLALWLGFALGVKTFAAWQEQSHRLLEIRRALAEAHLAQLKQQLRPHFLFNTLNTISSVMQTDVERADRLIARLADLLRVSMNVSGQDLVPLETELHVLELYADIMRERFGDRVAMTWNIADAARQIAVPALMLQPLLENAFRHGVEVCAGAQIITVRAQVEETGLALSIHNDGKLADDAREGIGLTNCRNRLRAHSGEHATLMLASDPSGVTSRVLLPLVPA